MRDDLTGIVQISVGLGVGQETLATAPPMIDTVKGFPEIIEQDAVEEVLATVAVLVEQGRSPFAFGYLPRRVAAETDALYPPDAGQEPSDVVRYQPRVQPLIKIYFQLQPDNLLNLPKPVVGGKHVVIHED